MTPAEREEHVMLHGSNYVNLPDTSYDPNRDVTWRQLDLSRHSGYCLKKVNDIYIYIYSNFIFMIISCSFRINIIKLC